MVPSRAKVPARETRVELVDESPSDQVARGGEGEGRGCRCTAFGWS